MLKFFHNYPGVQYDIIQSSTFYSHIEVLTDSQIENPVFYIRFRAKEANAVPSHADIARTLQVLWLPTKVKIVANS